MIIRRYRAFFSTVFYIFNNHMYIKPIACIHCMTKSGPVTWQFLNVNGLYFATNGTDYKGAKSFADLMRLKAIFMSYKTADGSPRFKAGRYRPAKPEFDQQEFPVTQPAEAGAF